MGDLRSVTLALSGSAIVEFFWYCCFEVCLFIPVNCGRWVIQNAFQESRDASERREEVTKGKAMLKAFLEFGFDEGLLKLKVLRQRKIAGRLCRLGARCDADE